MGLGEPDHDAGPARLAAGPGGLRRKHRRSWSRSPSVRALLSLQQQPQVGQGRIGLGHRQGTVEQRQRISHPALHHGHARSARAAPSAVAQLSAASGGLGEARRRRRWPAFSTWPRLRCVRAVSHEQPGPVAARGSPGRTGPGASAVRDSVNPAARACGTGPASSAGPPGDRAQTTLARAPCGYPLGLGRVADPVQGLSERSTSRPSCRASSRATVFTAWPRRFRRDPRSLADRAAGAVRVSQRRIHSSIGSVSGRSADRGQ